MTVIAFIRHSWIRGKKTEFAVASVPFVPSASQSIVTFHLSEAQNNIQNFLLFVYITYQYKPEFIQ